MTSERIVLNDGTKDVELLLIATFRLDEKDYCLVEDPEDDTSFFLRYETEGEDMVFHAIESEQEFDEVAQAYEELLSDQEVHTKKEE